MVASRTIMVISLGIFLGLLNYGLQTALTNYNSLVNPDEPLAIINVDQAKGEINLMGKNYKLSSIRKSINKQELQKQAVDIYFFIVDEYYRYLDFLGGTYKKIRSQYLD